MKCIRRLSLHVVVDVIHYDELDEIKDDRLVVVEQPVVCDMRHASALDFASQESQTVAIMVAIEVKTKHSLDDLSLCTDSL
nr:hypothetical protein [Tanacetum cinerariifolium]